MIIVEECELDAKDSSCYVYKPGNLGLTIGKINNSVDDAETERPIFGSFCRSEASDGINRTNNIKPVEIRLTEKSNLSLDYFVSF